MKRTLALALLAIVAWGTTAQAKLSVKQPCSDGMVLQQKTEALVWGHGDSNSKISVTTSWNGKSYNTTTDTKGVWKVKVKTPEAGYTAYEINIHESIGQDTDDLTIKNVLVGEVWLASGQSNMEMPIRGFFNCPVEGAADVVSAPAMRNKIRMLTVKIIQPNEPLDDVAETDGWQGADASTVSEMSATAYFFARQLNSTLDIPIGIVAFPRGGARVESWMPKEMVEKYGTEDLTQEGVNKMAEYLRPFQMYNGMQHPIQGYTAKGFIWYQGCSNVGKHDQFVARMTDLVARWRQDWGDKNNSMPFYQVEIAPYRYNSSEQSNNGALLRQAQHEAAEKIPNSAIIVTNDLAYSYETDQIHPAQKRQVGERLARLALHRDYGYDKVACYSPKAIRAYKTKNDDEIFVEFSNCDNGLDRWQEIEGLEVCGSEHIFKPVTYAHYEWEPRGLRIRCEGVWDPCEVRYGWGDFKPGNLHNCEGLPVTPFDIKLQ